MREKFLKANLILMSILIIISLAIIVEVTQNNTAADSAGFAGIVAGNVYSENLITNPDFSDASGWSFWANGSATFDMTESGPGFANAADIHILDDGSATGNNIQLYQQGIMLEPNSRYIISFMAKSNSENKMSVYVHKHGLPYTNYGLDWSDIELTSDWQSFSKEFTTEDFFDTIFDARLKFWFAPYATPGEIYYITNVSLVKMISYP